MFPRIYFVTATFLFFLTSCASTKDKSTNDKTKLEGNIPKITKPVVKKIWIPDEIKENGAVYEEGHFRYLIEKDPAWTK